MLRRWEEDVEEMGGRCGGGWEEDVEEMGGR